MIDRPADGSDKSGGHAPRFAFRRALPWFIVAGSVFAATWFGQRYVSVRTEVQALHTGNAFGEIALQSAQQQLEAERIIARHRLQDSAQQLDEAQRQIARLTADLKPKAGGDLAALKITVLASLLAGAPQALAIAVWDQARQEGVLVVEKLPAPPPNQDYQLWLLDPQHPNPVDGGVVHVDPANGSARLPFKPGQPVGPVKAFAITVERQGGVSKAEGPQVLSGK